MLSCLSSCASIAGSATSLIATHSISAARSDAARKAARPVRPKPLIATRMAIWLLLLRVQLRRYGAAARHASGETRSAPRAPTGNYGAPARTGYRDQGHDHRPPALVRQDVPRHHLRLPDERP